MVTLGEYIGLILSNLAAARAQADVESIRIAEIYASNPTLKNLAVPRMRISNFSITTPIIMEKADEKALKDSKKPIEPAEFEESIKSTMNKVIGTTKIPLSIKDSKIIQDIIQQKTVFRKSFSFDTLDTKTLSEKFVDSLSLPKLLKEKTKLSDDETNDLTNEIRTDLRARLSNLRTMPGLNVTINTGVVKELAPKETLTYLNLTINEDALEWAISESSGKTKEQLIPE